MVVKIEIPALENDAVTIKETVEFFVKIHSSLKSNFNIFSVPAGITHSVQKICDYINDNYFACVAIVVEGWNAFILFNAVESKTIH
ncbi:MAG: hypothetical protein FWH53_00690 [Leptospirales bacterium]|nr:hypothetical protein [Leptospirales bacterium]